jgi:hypothetical protein
MQVVGADTFDRLQILGLNSYLIDTLNLAIVAVVFPATIIIAMFIYEAIKYHTETVEIDEPTQAKIENEQTSWRERRNKE